MTSKDVPLPISFAEEKHDEEAYRGNTAVMSRGLEQNALNLKSDAMQGKNASMQAQAQQFGGKSSEIVTLVMDEAGVKTKLEKGGTENIFALKIVQDAPQTQVFNEVSSFSVQNMNETQIINKLNIVLNDYSDEIDFEVDTNKNEIKNGIVFINNYYSVFFTFWTAKESDNSTRFEFRRQSGDALASAKFLGDVKAKFFGASKEESKEKEADSLINLELNVDGMAELKVDESNKEMMMIHEALIDDEFVGDSLEENAENYLYQKLIENKAMSKENTIDHKILCKTLMTKSLLLHRDIAVVRASLIILNKFVNIYKDLLSSKDLKSLLLQVLKENKCKIVKQYTVNLLSQIAVLNKDKWELNDQLKENLSKEIKLYQESAKSNKNYDEKVFNNVYNKL